MAGRPSRSPSSRSRRLKQLWQKASTSLYGTAAMGLALGIGIGLGLWLGDVADPPHATQTAKTAPQTPPRNGPSPSTTHLSVAPWVPDPRREPRPALDLPLPNPLTSAPAQDQLATSVPVPQMTPVDPPREVPALLVPSQKNGGQPLWRRNAVPAPVANGRPMISIVIDDMGVDQRHSVEAAALPGPLTLSYLPYAHDLARQTATARHAGHELMVHVPMQPQSRTGANGHPESGGDPGPNALLVGLSNEEIRHRLDLALGAFDGYVGINNHMGSAFTVNRPGMATVIAELKSRGLLFLDSRTIAGSVGEGLAEEAGVAHATRNVFLDNIQTTQEVRTRLAELERIAKARGAAVAIGHPHETTIAVLKEWLPTVAGQGFVLVPLSAIVMRNEAAEQASRKSANSAQDAR